MQFDSVWREGDTPAVSLTAPQSSMCQVVAHCRAGSAMSLGAEPSFASAGRAGSQTASICKTPSREFGAPRGLSGEGSARLEYGSLARNRRSCKRLALAAGDVSWLGGLVRPSNAHWPSRQRRRREIARLLHAPQRTSGEAGLNVCDGPEADFSVGPIPFAHAAQRPMFLTFTLPPPPNP